MNEVASDHVISSTQSQTNPELNTPITMKLPTILRSVMALLAACLLTQCSSTPQTRIQQYPQLFAPLSSRDRQLVASGVIREGMTHNAVFLAWGRPGRVSVGSSRGRQIEQWTYVGQQPVRTMSMGFGFGGMGYGGYGMGYGMGGYGMGGYGMGGYPFYGGGPSVTYLPYTAGVVEFSKGVVTRWVANP